MKLVTLNIDQTLRIGRDIRVTPTDIDEKGARLIAQGRMIGGAEDGERFHTKPDMAVGQSLRFGPQVLLTLNSVRGTLARFSVFAPSNMQIDVQSVGDNPA